MYDVNPENVRFVANVFRGLYEDAIIRKAEGGLTLTDDHKDVPDPNSCHPAFTHAADFVRQYGSFGRDYVRVTMVKQMRTYSERESLTEPPSAALPVTVLKRVKAWGLAPYVGDPRINEARYQWSIWVDDYGRHVAGDSALIWRY